MGKATVISHNGSGLYTVTYHRNNEYLDRLVAALEAQIINLEINDIPILVLNVSTAEANVNQARAVFDAALAAYNADKSAENKAALDQAVKDLTYHGTEKRRFEDELKEAQAQLLGGRKRWKELRELRPEDETRQIWCADLVETIPAGTVVSITEVSGVQDNGVNIHPAFAGLHVYVSAEDGDNYHGESQSPEAFYYNTAMRPGWQKYVAKYRSAVIQTKFPNGTFDVLLDSVNSAASTQDIEVATIGDGPTSRALYGISSVYMDCDEKAFDEGDHVIVLIHYTDFGKPTEVRTETIIGFVDNPKPCGTSAFAYLPVSYSPGATIEDWQLVSDDTGAWQMTTPYTSDLTTEHAGTPSQPLDVIKDWKGFLNDGTPMVVQWIPYTSSSGDQIWLFVNGVKTARLPTRTFAPATGDSSASTTAYGFNQAWVTPDNSYIFAIVSINQESIHVIRKTTTVELTGGDYNASTLPDGWEFVTLGFSDYTWLKSPQGIGRTVTRNGVHFYANQNGTQCRGMALYVHGGARTPALDPDPNGVGAVWVSGLSTTDYWPEETVINIANPFAASLASAGVTLTENGIITDATNNGLFSKETNSTYVYYTGFLDCDNNGSGIYTEWHGEYNQKFEWFGGYAIDVGFVGDTVNYLWANGKGTYGEQYKRKQTWACDGTSDYLAELLLYDYLNHSSGDWGIWYEDSLGTLSVPLRVQYELNADWYWTFNTTSPPLDTCADGSLYEYTETYTLNGRLYSYDLCNQIYYTYTDSTKTKSGKRYSNTTGTTVCDGESISATENYLTGDIYLIGLNAVDLSRVESSTWPGAWAAASTSKPSQESQKTRTAGSADPDIVNNISVVNYINNTAAPAWQQPSAQSERWAQNYNHACRSSYSKCLALYRHTYNPTAADEHGTVLFGQPGGLDDLDGITGDDYTLYYFPHVVY